MYTHLEDLKVGQCFRKGAFGSFVAMSGRLLGLGILQCDYRVGPSPKQPVSQRDEVSKNLSVVGELLPVVVLILHHLLDVAFFVSSTCLFVMSSRL